MLRITCAVLPALNQEQRPNAFTQQHSETVAARSASLVSRAHLIRCHSHLSNLSHTVPWPASVAVPPATNLVVLVSRVMHNLT